ncbi:hypothetical protein C7T35_27365 [Variovorax sp. WS11]|nr:hypothetical protein C7T35_27365 [Variovorax sp. WS11]
MSLRTLQRYAASGNTPRAVYLALWFEGRWALNTLHAQAVNEAQHARAGSPRSSVNAGACAVSSARTSMLRHIRRPNAPAYHSI